MSSFRKIEVKRIAGALGAEIHGADLRKALADETVAEIRRAFLEHLVVFFRDQELTPPQFMAFARRMGTPIEYPFVKGIAGFPEMIEVKKLEHERHNFGGVWHSDTAYLEVPPMASMLLAREIPPVGGDTLFANQHAALDAMPKALRSRLEGRMGIHSAKRAYAPEGTYGADDKGRSMDIRPSTAAEAVQLHPIIRRHPETGREGVFSCFGYIIGIEGMPAEESTPLLLELYQWQSREEFQYRHKWKPSMLLMWDNRSVLHAATGGYDGYDRILHRTTIAASP